MEVSAGQFALRGELSFATVASLLKDSTPLFARSKDLGIDLSGVSFADSAGLALLIEWLRLAKRQGITLKYSALPAQLESLAAVSEVDALLTA